MPQLTRMTTSSGLLLNFKWPYHANVMNTFEQVSSTTGSQRDDVKSMPEKLNSSACGVKLECAGFAAHANGRKRFTPISRKLDGSLAQLLSNKSAGCV